MFIKPLLREELENSERLRAGYERELAKLPKGSLVRKKVGAHAYFYLVYREGKKVHLEYRGKHPGEKEIARFAEVKKLRALYRKNLSQVKRQIRYLKGVLRVALVEVV